MKLHAIIIGEKAKEPLQYVKGAQLVAGKGIKGDRYYYQKGTFNKPQLSQEVREISLIAYDALAECNERLQSNLDFLDLRRNLVIKNLHTPLKQGSILKIGSSTLKIVRTAPPCRYLSRLLNVDMMKGLNHIGGFRATILESGEISIGDRIEIIDLPFNT